MNKSNPAIVTQSAVRRMPRAALLLLCLAYVLPGLFGRAPWRSDDINAFGFMLELARGGGDWWSPRIMGLAPEVDALLPYWLGAWAIQLAPAWLGPDNAVRIASVALLSLALVATWYGAYHLARSPKAQPLAFAFGGEAQPADYARALADGALLALIACLGLAQPAHETTASLAQLSFSALVFYGFAAAPSGKPLPLLSVGLGLAALALSGAPSVAVLLGLGGSLSLLSPDPEQHPSESGTRRWATAVAARAVLITCLVALMASALDLWRWRITVPGTETQTWLGLGKLLVWFTWPAWPLALWTLWRWRHHFFRAGQLPSKHLLLPLWFAGLALLATLFTHSPERSLLLALPPLATLAAFALPTLNRSLSALIDWFTLLFFSGCAFIIWVVWVAMQTGVPWQPAANVERLAPGFVPSFAPPHFLIALAATLCWVWLVRWRVGRHRAAIWKSLILPAGGAALCWLLLMTLWLPLLDYARSYLPMVAQAQRSMQGSPCAQQTGLNAGQITALRFHGGLVLTALQQQNSCAWLIVGIDPTQQALSTVDASEWTLQAQSSHPTDREDYWLIYRRRAQTGL